MSWQGRGARRESVSDMRCTEITAVRAVLLGASVLLAQACVPVSPEQVFRRAARSVVMVYAADPSQKIVGRGSGVVVAPDLLVTNCHVIARGKLFLAGQRQARVHARLVAYDGDQDLCALAARGLDAVPVRIGETGKLSVGQRVYALGAPEGFELTFSEGLVSGLREAAGGRYLQITAPVSEGSSGGGLFDSEGRLIGITTFVFSPGQNLNFAAPAEWVRALAAKASGARREGVAPEIELPPSMTTQWRHPLLK